MEVRSKGAAARKNKKKTQAAAKKPKQSLSPQNQRYSLYVAVGLLVAVVFLCYANSLWNEFVFDDHHLVLVLSRPKSFEHLIQLMLHSYRPMRNLSYALDFFLWGERPFGFHLTNILIHSTNTALVFFLARRLMGKTPTTLLAAFIAALVFAVHPIQTDAVTYISGRRDILFSLFYIAAFLSYIAYRRSKSLVYFGAFLGLWAFSLMSKEMAVSLPIVVFLWNFCDLWGEYQGSWFKRTIEAIKNALARDKWLYAALLAAMLAYGCYMVFYKNASGRALQGELNYWGGSFFANMLTAIRVHAWYLKQLIYPTPIAQYFGAFDISYSLFDWRVILALIVVGAALVAAFALLKKDKLMSFAILSYFAMLLPVSQIIPHHELLADHYLYLPMMSFGLLVAQIVRMIAARSKQARRLAYGVVAVFAVVLALMTVARNRDWKNDFTLWQANYEAVPNSPRAAYNLGGMYLQRDPRRAEELFRQSLAADPDFEFTYQALARLLVSQKRTAEAQEIIRKGLELVDSNPGSYVSRNPPLIKSQLLTMLAASKWEEGDAQKAEQILQEAIKMYAPNPEPYTSLANMYRGKDRAKEIEALKRGVAANPTPYETNSRLASLLVEDKRYDEALAQLRRMATLSPTQGDCRKGRPYIAAARSAAPKSMEWAALTEALQRLEQRCAE